MPPDKVYVISAGNRTTTTESSKNGAITPPGMNVSGYVGHTAAFS